MSINQKRKQRSKLLPAEISVVPWGDAEMGDDCGTSLFWYLAIRFGLAVVFMIVVAAIGRMLI